MSKPATSRTLIRIILSKLTESALSVLPVAILVCVLHVTPLVSLTNRELGVFLLSAVLLVIGMSLFNLGADMAMTPMGEHIGAGLTRSRKMVALLGVCFAMGVLITVAEPDLSVLAAQVKDVMNPTALILTVGVGVGLFLMLAVIKMVSRRSLASLLLFLYMVLFAVGSLVVVNGNGDFLSMAFDSGGVTTGPITVPFLMALGVGIATTLGGRNVGENSFGLIALCSVGPILAVLLLGITSEGGMAYTVPDYSLGTHFLADFVSALRHTAGEVALALGLIVAFFLILQFVCLRLPVRKIGHIGVGILYTFAGLVIFLSAVSEGFMPIGYKLGSQLADSHPAALLIFGFVIGMVVVLAEPAVHVLNKQVEDVTDGTVSKGAMMVALCIGVGISIALSMLRILYDFSILYYVIPGYLLSLGLSFFVPGLYTAIAFDSGGVASGPLTSSFILPFAVGACVVLQGESRVLTDAFGVVAMVAMTPLITIQLLGFRAVLTRRVKAKVAMKRMLQADDEQIIQFL